MAYSGGRHRSGQPGLVRYARMPADRFAGTPRHLRRQTRLVAPVTLTLTLGLSLMLLVVSGYATAAGAVAVATMFAP